MKRDKAALAYDGESQLARAFRLVGTRVDGCYVSIRADQSEEPLRQAYPRIVDGPLGSGPIAGLLAAQAAQPESAWLVVACDLPFLDGATLDRLIAARDPDAPATAYRSAHDGLPEPLCAIWEPASHAALLDYVATGRHCPRKFLIGRAPRLLDLEDPRALDNVNAAAEYWQAMDQLAAAAAPLRLRVQYFALLREQAGLREESVETRARSPRELYEQLRTRHGFTLAPDLLRVSVNAEFGDWSQPLVDGDAVVFIPPVAGG
jgi:molybdopterin-guanine dinucleotide biosynthesis protein A